MSDIEKEMKQIWANVLKLAEEVDYFESNTEYVDLLWTFAPEDPRPDVSFTVPLQLGLLVEELSKQNKQAYAEVERLREVIAYKKMGE